MTFFNKLTARHLCYASLLLILILFLPSIVQGLKNSHDIRFHATWFISFKESFYSGDLYPRWMQDQFAGLGAPTFYFYPPLTTYFFILTDLLTLRLLPEDHTMAIAGFLMSVISACTFHVWIKNFTSPKIAVVASLFYAVAPYHLMIDYYNRSAMAEFAAYMWIPLIFAGIYHIIHRPSVRWVLILAASIFALFITHLLTTLVIAPVAVLYGLLVLKDRYKAEGNKAISKLMLLGITGFAGAGLAALYFLPAITMMDDINNKALRWYNPASNYIYRAITNPSSKDHFLLKIFTSATAHLCLTIYMWIEFFIARKDGPSRIPHHALLMLGASIVTYAFMMGAFPALFEAPSPYKEIQFPWRLMVLLEFTTVSGAIALAYNFASGRQAKRALSVIFVTVAILISLQAFDIYNRAYKTRDSHSILMSPLLNARLSSEEYLPAGSNFPHPHKNMEPIVQYSKQEEQAVITDGKGKINKLERNGSSFTMDVTARTPVDISLYQFYFPGWAAHDESGKPLEVLPHGSDRLVSFRVDKGEHKISINRVETEQEKTGKIASLISAFILILCIIWARRFQKK